MGKAHLMKPLLIVVLSFCVTMSYSCAAPVTAIPLVIDNPSGLAEIWPLTCGVPFPKGKIKDVSSLWIEDSTGKRIPCQIDVTATWLRDKSVRWVLVNFQGRPDGSYFLKVGDAGSSSRSREGIHIKKYGSGMTINTGAAKFIIGRDDALISRGTINGKVFLKNSGSGAYLIDNQGRKAWLGGKGSEMSTRFVQKGPLCTVLRKEGWYVTKGRGERLARGIVWLYFYGNSPYVKVVHKLVLTEDTNKVWFKDIGIDFSTGFTRPRKSQGWLASRLASIRKKGIKAAFDTSPAVDTTVTTIPLKKDETAWMLQDDFPHFSSTTSHFSLVHKTKRDREEVTSGSACGDWCDLSTRNGGLTVTLRNFAEQFPKEFTATPDGITVHLWAGRCGRELDFRTKTLAREYWEEWAEHAPGGAEALAKVPSNAQSSAKTHILWLLPHTKRIDISKLSKRAHAAAERILVIPDPAWTCDTATIGPPMHPKDIKRFPEEEKFISDFYDRMAVTTRVFPLTGYIAWGCSPGARISRNKKTGKWATLWWRIYGADYETKRHIWTLYARSGNRKYFEHGERYNRFAGDMLMHHWDVGTPGSVKTRDGKFKGGFASAIFPKGVKWPGDYDIPIYWRWMSYGLGETYNYLCHFYFTGDWDVWELAEDHERAVKKYAFMRPTRPSRGAAVPLRFLTALYSMHWDEQLGKVLHDLAHKVIDLKSRNAIYEKTPPHALYKISRNVIPMYEYWHFTGDEHSKKGLIKMMDYEYRFARGGENRPIGYRNGAALMYSLLYEFTGEKKYLALAKQSIVSGFRQWYDELQGRTPLPPDPKNQLQGLPGLCTACFNYHTCLGMPIALRPLANYQGPPLKPGPVVRKNKDSTSQAWAVFEKKKGEAVQLDILFKLMQAEDVKVVVKGPDLKPVTEVEVLEKQQGIISPFTPGAVSYFVKAKIPAHLPAGTYRVGHENRGGFTVLDANVERMVLECPDGVWVGGPVPFYFQVPEGRETVKLFTQCPIRVFRPDGSLALTGSREECGEVSLSVEKKPGMWRLEFPNPAFVQFRNVPSVVAYATPDRFFVPKQLLQVSEEQKPDLPDSEATFVESVIGQGLQLNKKDVLKFERGKKLAGGTWENFPGNKGTIEFWFRPNWSAVYSVNPPSSLMKWGRSPGFRRRLFSAGSLYIRYRYEPGLRTFATMDFSCGRGLKKNAKGKCAAYGNHARIFPKAGEWTHIAATWDSVKSLVDATGENYRREEHFFVFINGKRYMRIGGPGRLRHYLGKSYAEDFDLSDIPEWISLPGSADGTFDELRISDTVRYMGDFVPSKTPFTYDEHTKALFHFDGSVEGINSNDQKIIVEFKGK